MKDSGRGSNSIYFIEARQGRGQRYSEYLGANNNKCIKVSLIYSGSSISWTLKAFLDRYNHHHVAAILALCLPQHSPGYQRGHWPLRARRGNDQIWLRLWPEPEVRNRFAFLPPLSPSILHPTTQYWGINQLDIHITQCQLLQIVHWEEEHHVAQSQPPNSILLHLHSWISTNSKS